MAVATPAPERAAGRRRLAKQSKALPDGSFPIPNVSYLKKAIRAVGRASAGKRPAIARLIRKRARQLGAWNVVKGSWADNTQSAKAMAHALNGQLIELGFSPELAKAETQATMAFMLREFATPVTSSTDGPRVTTLASGGGRKKRYDPDNDGDDDASPTGDTDKDYAGKLNAVQRAAMKRMIAKGMDPQRAYKLACNIGGGMKKAA